MVPPSQQSTGLEPDSELQNRVQRLADTRHCSPDSVMLEAIAEYVAREEQRELFRADTEAAWAEYQATGFHPTAEEAESWLARLEAGEQVDPPACHR